MKETILALLLVGALFGAGWLATSAPKNPPAEAQCPPCKLVTATGTVCETIGDYEAFDAMACEAMGRRPNGL